MPFGQTDIMCIIGNRYTRSDESIVVDVQGETFTHASTVARARCAASHPLGTVLAMSDVRILPATADLFDDAERVLDASADGASCQCQWWMLTNADYQRADRDERSSLLRDQIGAPVAPALIAYVDDDPAGWVRVGPRPAQVRLARTKEFAAATQPWDDDAVWAVSCFVVRKEHRGRGLATHLLDAAVDHARANGATVVEGYPLDPETARPPADKLFRGVLSVFEKGGFEIVDRPQPGRTIVALTL